MFSCSALSKFIIFKKLFVPFPTFGSMKMSQMFNPLTPMSDWIKISPHNINQIIDENKEKYQFEDNKLIQYWILWTNIIRILWLTVRRNTNLIKELKG